MLQRKRKRNVAPQKCEDEDKGSSGKKAHLNKNTNLIAALEKDDILAVKNILGNKDLKLAKASANTALLKAVEEGKKQIVQLLLNYGVSITEDEDSGYVTGSLALVAATEHGYWDIVKQLVKKGAPVNGKNSAGKTALMVAVEKSCSSALVSFLINDCKADVNLQDNTGKTALMLAVEQWDFATVQTLFMNKHYICDEDIKTKDGFTALNLSKRNGSAELMNVFSQSRRQQISPLSLMAGRNDFDLVRQLIQIYPTCVKSHHTGPSPLAAAMHGMSGEQNVQQNEWEGKVHCSLELMDFLLQKGVDINKHHPCGYAPLMFAAISGSEVAVQMLLRHGPNLDEVSIGGNGDDMNSQTALMMATRRGFAGIVNMLVEAGTDLYKTDPSGKNALHLAIANGQKTCSLVLLRHWKDLNRKDIELMEKNKFLDTLINVKDKWNQLLKDAFCERQLFDKAIRARSYPLVKAMIDYGTDINNCSRPLLSALEDVDMVRLLLNHGADVNKHYGPLNCTPLTMAAASNTLPPVVIHLLLEHKADMYFDATGHSALTLACSNDNPEAVRVLLDGGMDINHVTGTDYNITALWCALRVCNFSLTETLIERGADVNFASKDGITVLMYAINHCPIKFANLILQSGADINAEDDIGDTALFQAVMTSFDEEDGESIEDLVSLVLLLLQQGADVNHMNSHRVTPLIRIAATEYYYFEVLKVLLANKPKINVQDKGGDTALHYAVQLPHAKEKLSALVNSGASLNMANKSHKTPLMVAVQHLQVETVKFLISQGADASFKSSSQVSLKWKSQLSYMFTRYMEDDIDDEDTLAFYKCLEALLEAGCSLHHVQSFTLDRFLGMCTLHGENKIVRFLLQSGVGPNLFDMAYLRNRFNQNLLFSPLKNAILCGRPEIIAFMSQACFFHPKDVIYLQETEIRVALKKEFSDWPNKKYFSVEEVFPENWSLRTWSKLVLLRAVGYGEDREDRVRALPIPRVLQDELLLKNISPFPEKKNI